MVSSTALVSLLSLATASMAAVLPRNETLSASGSGSGAIPGPGTTHEGDITHYTPNGGIGACGNALQNGEAICALSAPLYDKCMFFHFFFFFFSPLSSFLPHISSRRLCLLFFD